MRKAGVLELLEPGLHEAQVGAVIHPRAVGGQIRALGHAVQPGKQRNSLIEDQIHDVALALLAQELQCKQAAHGALGGDHLAAGQARSGHHALQVDSLQQRHEHEQAGQRRAKGTRRQIQPARIGHGGRLGFEPLGPLLIAPARQAGKALFTQQHRQSVDADALARLGQFALDVVDGHVALAHGNRQLAHAIACRRALGAMARAAEELALVGVVAELMAEHPKGAWRIAESLCGFLRRTVFDEVCAQCFVLALQGMIRGEEERCLWIGYVFTSTDRHIFILLSYQYFVKRS